MYFGKITCPHPNCDRCEYCSLTFVEKDKSKKVASRKESGFPNHLKIIEIAKANRL